MLNLNIGALEQKVNNKPIQKLLEVTAKDEANGAALFSTSGFASKISEQGIYEGAVGLRDMVALHKLCQFYIESKKGNLQTGQTLEEIFNMSMN